MNAHATPARCPMACLRTCLAPIAFLLLLAVTSPKALAGLPLPSITFYGLFLDAYGWPYPESHLVEVHSDGQRILTRNLSSASGKDYNFLVRIPYDSGGELDDYTPGVIGFGSPVEVRLIDPTGRRILSTNFVVQLPAGAVINFNTWSGSDSLGDGLPDELRRWIWAAEGSGLAFVPSRYRAADDSDGDGVSNLDEFRAGTDPANPEDVLALSIQPQPSSPAVQLSFFSVPGKTYRLQVGDLRETGIAWSDAPFSRAPGNTPDTINAPGTGHWLSVFVDASPASRLYRVTVLPQPRGSRLVP